MPRKPKNRAYEESIARLSKVIEQPEFIEAINRFNADWICSGYPSILDERHNDWDYNRNRTVYSGLYYDIRELCENFKLVWPLDANTLMRFLYAWKEGDTQYLHPVDIPPERDWQWFRMARTGLGLPRESEKDAVRKIGRGVYLHWEGGARGSWCACTL